MRRRDRLAIYLALAVLGVSNLLLLAGGGADAAFADARAWLETLGPADSLTLVETDGESGEADLTLQNIEGRLAWSEDATDRAHSAAFVHIGKVMPQLNPTLGECIIQDEAFLKTSRKPLNGLRKPLIKVMPQLNTTLG